MPRFVALLSSPSLCLSRPPCTFQVQGPVRHSLPTLCQPKFRRLIKKKKKRGVKRRRKNGGKKRKEERERMKNRREKGRRGDSAPRRLCALGRKINYSARRGRLIYEYKRQPTARHTEIDRENYYTARVYTRDRERGVGKFVNRDVRPLQRICRCSGCSARMKRGGARAINSDPSFHT